MTVAEEIPFLSFENYLAAEKQSTKRHEYVYGRVYVMAGSTDRHNMMVGAIFARLRSNALAAGCRPFVTDHLIRLGDVAYYPDVYVTCSPSGEGTYQRDLSLVVEVLSPSTADTDRREKAGVYASAPSFEQYLVVHPEWRRVEVATKASDGRLQWEVHGGGSIVFTRFGELNVDELYGEVDSALVD